MGEVPGQGPELACLRAFACGGLRGWGWGGDLVAEACVHTLGCRSPACCSRSGFADAVSLPPTPPLPSQDVVIMTGQQFVPSDDQVVFT